MRRPLLALTALAFAAAAAIASGSPPGASARAGRPGVAACALGTSGPDLRGFAAPELARARRHVRGGRRARRTFTAAAAAAGRTPSRDSNGAVRTALARGAAVAERLVARAVARANAYSRKRNNGWLVPLDYVGDYGRNYLGRAVIAKLALGANTPEETIYPSALTDSRGRPLSGHRRYSIRFRPGELPLHPNTKGRYAIGDRTRGLRRGSDGSLTLYVQSRAPSGRRRANWLPAPRGRFRLIMRLYEPGRRALSGDWRPPPVRRQ
ncbi:MAG TPA: DUF1214 domain-containing protein [Thermoleophilaceae bacterium]|nr:DUF1214 domain-containing protein [Thermoleophilaceae bacterium]